MHDAEEIRGAFARLPGDVGDLVKAELRLFTYELRSEAAAIARVAAGFALAAVFGLVALLALSAAAIAGLAAVVPVWLAALIIGVLFLIVAAVVTLSSATALRNDVPVPFERTRNSIKEGLSWIQTYSRSAQK